MSDRAGAGLGLLCVALMAWSAAAPAWSGPPLSASDWLSGSLRGPVRESSAWTPGDRPPPGIPGGGNALPIASSGTVGRIEVSRLDDANLDIAGTRSSRKAGLPHDLWAGSDAGALAQLLAQTPARLPAMNALLQRIVTAQLAPPRIVDGRPGQLFLARADRLLDMGALDQAQALLLAAGPGNPEVFRRLFDIALLQGDESRACGFMDNTPGIAPSFAARIFCLAQSGDWAAAAISLRGAEQLGLIGEEQALLLTHFLDDGFVDDGTQLQPPARLTPLEFRIFEAIGQPLPTQSLPVAFAQSDLRSNNGWKARLEAAERLARSGAIGAERLRDIYAEQKPAASGGVWERADAMRALEAAIVADDIRHALPRAFEEFRRAQMAGILAQMVAADLPETTDPRAAEIRGWLRQWQGLDPVAQLVPALTEAQPALTEPRGRALLQAMADIDAGIEGDLPRAGRGLATLRALGLDADADLATAQLTLHPLMTEPAP